jgi:hypothetical protein
LEACAVWYEDSPRELIVCVDQVEENHTQCLDACAPPSCEGACDAQLAARVEECRPLLEEGNGRGYAACIDEAELEWSQCVTGCDVSPDACVEGCEDEAALIRRRCEGAFPDDPDGAARCFWEAGVNLTACLAGCNDLVFACGTELCAVGQEYCNIFYPGIPDAPISYDCVPLPDVCADSPECMCLSEALELGDFGAGACGGEYGKPVVSFFAP